MAVPYIFQNVTGSIPLANLDTNFTTPIVIGSTSITLGTTVTSLAGLTAVTATTGTYSNLAVSGTVSGTGFSAYLASPPPVGGTVPNTGAFTTLTSNSTTILNGTSIPPSKTLLVSTDIGVTVQAWESKLDVWATKTAPSGTVIGSSDTQTLTNKTISADSNTLSGIAASSFVLSNGSGNIDGAAAQKVIPAGVVVGTTDTQTLTNKTLTNPTVTTGSFTSPTITTGTTSGKFTFGGAIDETVYAVVDAAGVALSPANGTIQTWTLGASRTPTAGTWDAGESMTLMINDGTAYTITWTTLAVTWVGGTAPAIATTGFTVVELWKVGTTIYGALVGNVA